MGVLTSSAESKSIDAGIRSLEHYRERLPPWRFNLRERLIPLLRWETPYVAAIQRKCRTPSLDSYFAFTANLGTHTFFMIVLPVLFFCGHIRLARAMTHMLASGVFLSGFVKDLLCLPRPLSPPLQRITISTSAALEYGYPSTHSTNAMSVVYYAFHFAQEGLSPKMAAFTQSILCIYGASIVVGRVYCGMHGFFDVVSGSLLGIVIALVQMQLGDAFDLWISSGPFSNVTIIVFVVLLLVRIHPEPADDCPCFDDSIAFSGVVIGLQFGAWRLLRNFYSLHVPISPSPPYSIQEMGYFKAALRIILGVVVVFLWRGSMKPSLLKILPPIFRVVERSGLTLPRRFHLRATQYGEIPPLRKDDNVIPSISEIPSMITSLRNPRKRTISIGAQSEADVYEALAYRERQRRDSQSASPDTNNSQIAGNHVESFTDEEFKQANGTSRIEPKDAITDTQGGRVSPNINYKRTGEDVLIMPTGANSEDGYHTIEALTGAHNGELGKEIFHKIHVPRVRYDVEVVTKLIVYTGIGWLASEFNFLLFELVGLGIPR